MYTKFINRLFGGFMSSFEYSKEPEIFKQQAQERCDSILKPYRKKVRVEILYSFDEQAYLSRKPYKWYHKLHTPVARLVISTKFVSILDTDEMNALLGHEMGHLFHEGYIDDHSVEYLADAMSISLGGTVKGAESLLNKVCADDIFYYDLHGIKTKSETHPHPIDRIERLHALIRKS